MDPSGNESYARFGGSWHGSVPLQPPPSRSRTAVNQTSSIALETRSNPPGRSKNEPRVVVAIDFGTTFTGLAWVFVRKGQPLPTADAIQLHEEWPGGRSTKVPSAISWSPSREGRLQWGHDIEPDSKVMRWTKLELHGGNLGDEIKRLRAIVQGLSLVNDFRAEAALRVRSNNIPRDLGMSGEAIVAEYLTRVVREWFSFQQADLRSLFNNVPLDLVITHPSEWTYEAQNKTVRAVLRAFSVEMFPMRRYISLVPEPEACALYTAHNAAGSDRGRLQRGDCFVVCDAGGGTVDLVAYRLESTSPFAIKRVSAPVCVRGGASQIDRDFFKFLDRILRPFGMNLEDVGPGGHYVLNELAEELLKKFIPIKHSFDGEAQARGITLPRRCAVLDDPWAQSKVVNRAIKLDQQDMKDIFDPTIDQVIEFIARQELNLTAGGNRDSVTHLFMSGGFSSSPYLLSRVREWARWTGIQVEQGEDCWGAVVRGAVMKGAGIGADLPAISNICPRSYGVVADRYYMDYMDVNLEDVVGDGDQNGMMARSQIIWLVSIGDLLPAEEPLVRSYDVYCKTSSRRHGNIVIPFIASASHLRDRAKRLADSERARDEQHLLQIKISDIPSGDWRSVPRPGAVLGGGLNMAKIIIEIRISDKIHVKATSHPSERAVATCSTAL